MCPSRSTDSASTPRLFDLCRSLPGVTEDVKWQSNLVFSVGGKMFAVFDLPEGRQFSFKVDPDTFDVLTSQPGVIPAPYLAKHSWVKLEDDRALPHDVVADLIEESHTLVASKLTRKQRSALGLA